MDRFEHCGEILTIELPGRTPGDTEGDTMGKAARGGEADPIVQECLDEVVPVIAGLAKKHGMSTEDFLAHVKTGVEEALGIAPSATQATEE